MNNQLVKKEIKENIISPGVVVGTLCFVDFKEIILEKARTGYKGDGMIVV